LSIVLEEREEKRNKGVREVELRLREEEREGEVGGEGRDRGK
jgi:hypothetical protein